jgi:hypothetical protein
MDQSCLVVHKSRRPQARLQTAKLFCNNCACHHQQFNKAKCRPCGTRAGRNAMREGIIRAQLKSRFSEIPTRFLIPYREFEQRPHTPHWRQLDSNSRYAVRKCSRVTSTLAMLLIFEQLTTELRPQRSQEDIPYHFTKGMVCQF